MVKTISRRHMAQLFVITLAGAGVGHMLRKSSPVGRDVSANETARALLTDRTFPSRDVGQPTLTFVLFTDYRCPACKLSNAAMEKALQQDDHVRIIYRDWPIFGPASERAARVAIASDRQGIYPLVHARLMNERRTLEENTLRQAIEYTGGSWRQIEADLEAYAADIDRQLDRTQADAFQLGISGTPAYLAGSILLTGAQDEGRFRRLFAAGRQARQGQV
ncbi:DsbA family protein [Sphingorhabdus sp.]|uniref:DsbA family protein n=1 Tax=Sphingorhabdus sp. TaxID=1902408 RepID=UPI00391B7988